MTKEEILEKRIKMLEGIVDNIGNIETRDGMEIADHLVTGITERVFGLAYIAVRYFFVDPYLSHAFNMVDNPRRRVLDTALAQCQRDGIPPLTALTELLDVINVLLDVKPKVVDVADAEREKIVDIIMYQNLLQSIVEYYNADYR